MIPNLVITGLPNRKGMFLAIETDTGIRTLARFSYDGAEREFVEWAVKAGLVHNSPAERES